jgi:hypothetical protein
LEYSSFVGIVEDCFEKQSVFIEYFNGENSFWALVPMDSVDAMDFSVMQL